MKKRIFSFAIAMVATLGLVSCNGSSDNTSKSGETSEVTEQTQDQDGEQAQEEVKIEDLKELTCDNYAITVPDGWKASSKMVRTSCNLTLKENPHSTAVLGYTLQNEGDVKSQIENRGGKAIDDITVNGKTYKVFIAEKDDRATYEAYVPNGDGFVTVKVMPGGTPMKGDELKEVLTKNLNDIIGAIALK